MITNARYVHTNLIAQNWRKLAEFYQEVFGCKPVPPGRKLSGQWLERGTGVSGAEIRGMHLRLPGHGEKGPTLEIFEYNYHRERPEPAVNRPGFAHIAFAVQDVEAVRNKVIAAGGKTMGELVSAEIPGAGKVTFVYVTDPEGNVIELQKWED